MSHCRRAQRNCNKHCQLRHISLFISLISSPHALNRCHFEPYEAISRLSIQNMFYFFRFSFWVLKLSSVLIWLISVSIILGLTWCSVFEHHRVLEQAVIRLDAAHKHIKTRKESQRLKFARVTWAFMYSHGLIILMALSLCIGKPIILCCSSLLPRHAVAYILFTFRYYKA